MNLKHYFVEGLGHASYLISSDGTKEAAVVDPGRDVQTYVQEAQAAGLRIRYALETHNHNDFISGARQLSVCVGAEHVASAEAGLKFPYHAVRDGDELRLGELLIKVLSTPGHTPEHVIYVVVDTSRAEVPVLAFTGGDLLVGSVGRPDLLGKELGEKLAPLLYDSLQNKIMKLEDYVEICPTHGAGSLCGKGMSGKRTSTIGYERHFNPALQRKTRKEFVQYVLSGNPGIPTYYRRMRPINQEGPPVWHVPDPHPLTPAQVTHLAGHGAIILDTRAYDAFGAAHIPGAINVALDTMFTTWVGWLVPADVPMVLILEDDRSWGDVLTRLARIGYEKIVGYLQFGMGSWTQAALPVSHVPQWSVQELHDRLAKENVQVLDVRMDSEWDAGHIVGAVHIVLGDLPRRFQEVDRERLTVVICGTGYRSSIATSLLLQRGFRNVVNVLGGMTAWYAAAYPTTRGQKAADGHTEAEQVRVRDEYQFSLPARDSG
jgi:hydroxyacylglutathione hydrolase